MKTMKKIFAMHCYMGAYTVLVFQNRNQSLKFSLKPSNENSCPIFQK